MSTLSTHRVYRVEKVGMVDRIYRVDRVGIVDTVDRVDKDDSLHG